MLITTAHLQVLNELVTSEAAGQAIHTLREDDPQENLYRVLELQGLVLLEEPRSYRLTYAGREAQRLFAAMRQAALLPPLDQLKHDWHFLGSDILAALQAAHSSDKERVGPVTTQMLGTRGLTENAHDTLEKQSFVRLNSYGEAWLDFARRHRPRLEIDGDLANSMHHMTPGYTGRPGADTPPEHVILLEAMDLLTWSVPESNVYALTALGQAAYEALRKGGGYGPVDAVLDEPTLEVLALFVDKGKEALTSEQMADLEMLGYVGLDETVSAAGQAAMRAYALLQQETPTLGRTFAITEAEGELLATVHQLTESSKDTQMRPDKETLHRVLVDRMVKRYQDIEGRYGRTLKEQVGKKRKAVTLLEHLKSHDEWFNTFWDIEELLVSLDSFGLVRPEVEETKTVYRLTENGHKVVLEQAGKSRDISATAVKVLTTAITRLHAPADAWVEQARAEELIGTGGVTKAGRFYADLAQHCERKPALTREEAELLANLPRRVSETPALAAKDRNLRDEEKREWAFEKLEARGYIDRLVDGQITRTEIGQLLSRAVSGALQLGHPVTPTIVRLLAAIRQVGTLYVKERKVRIQPENWVEVERMTGLGPHEFKEAVHIARLGHYIGEVHITEAGLELLAVQEQLDSRPEQKQPEHAVATSGSH